MKRKRRGRPLALKECKMGEWRDENTGKKKKATKPAAPAERTPAEERAALRKEYFRKSHKRHSTVSASQKRLLDA